MSLEDDALLLLLPVNKALPVLPKRVAANLATREKKVSTAMMKAMPKPQPKPQPRQHQQLGENQMAKSYLMRL